MNLRLRGFWLLVVGAALGSLCLPAAGGATHGTPAFLENGHVTSIPNRSGGVCTFIDTCFDVEHQNPTNAGVAIRGIHSSLFGAGPGVIGETSSTSASAFGVLGRVLTAFPGENSAAVRGENNGTDAEGFGVWGTQNGAGVGVVGSTPFGRGVYGLHSGFTGAQPGVLGQTNSGTTNAVAVQGVVNHGDPGNGSAGVLGENLGYGSNGRGVEGWHSGSGWGVLGNTGRGGIGVYGFQQGTEFGYGVRGDTASTTANAAGVYGQINSSAANAAGIRGQNLHSNCCGMGVAGFHFGAGIGVYGEALNGFAVSGFSPNNWSGYFQGNVRVVGNLQKNSGSFTIDHPLDPANKYLSHSFVESPDMKNVYDGVVRTDAKGFATVKLPRYFQALNRDFRYQLTAIGQPAQMWIANKVRHNRFTIRTDKPNVEVSWQVTGIRKDRWANAHRIVVEEAKKPSERGKYLNPELFGKSPTSSVVFLPGLKKVSARKLSER